MSEEATEPHRDMVDYLRDNTIFARHSRLETRDFLDRLEADGYFLGKLNAEAATEVAPEDDQKSGAAVLSEMNVSEVEAASHD